MATTSKPGTYLRSTAAQLASASCYPLRAIPPSCWQAMRSRSSSTAPSPGKLRWERTYANEPVGVHCHIENVKRRRPVHVINGTTTSFIGMAIGGWSAAPIYLVWVKQ